MRKPILLIYLAEHIRTIRKEYGLTQLELANRIGTSRQTISRLESGEAQHLPSIRTLNLIADACKHRLIITFKKKGGYLPATKKRRVYHRPDKLV